MHGPPNRVICTGRTRVENEFSLADALAGLFGQTSPRSSSNILGRHERGSVGGVLKRILSSMMSGVGRLDGKNSLNSLERLFSDPSFSLLAQPPSCTYCKTVRPSDEFSLQKDTPLFGAQTKLGFHHFNYENCIVILYLIFSTTLRAKEENFNNTGKNV